MKLGREKGSSRNKPGVDMPSSKSIDLGDEGSQEASLRRKAAR
jgi:hypothetical protein